MEALYAILGFLFVTLGFATGYRFWERRSRHKLDGAVSSSEIERRVETPLMHGEPAILMDVQTEEPISPSGKGISGEEIDAEVVSAEEVFTEETTTAQPSIPLELKPDILPESSFTPPPEIPDPWLSDLEPAVTESVIVPPVPGASTPIAEPSLAVTDAVALKERIASLGRSGQLHYAASLMRYTNHANSSVRAAVAMALGNLATRRSGTSVETLIPVLGRLSQDTKTEVRVAAVEALGKIRSPKVLPWLQRSQQSDPQVRKAATSALQRLKLIYQPKAAKLKPEGKKKEGRG